MSLDNLTIREVRENNAALVRAAIINDTKELSRLLPISDPKDSSSLALRMAAKFGNLDAVKILVPVSDTKNGDLPRKEDAASDALQEAAKFGRTAVVKYLLPVSDPKSRKNQAMYLAAANGHADCVKLIQDSQNSNIDKFGVDTENWVDSLKIAVQRGHGNVIDTFQPSKNRLLRGERWLGEYEAVEYAKIALDALPDEKHILDRLAKFKIMEGIIRKEPYAPELSKKNIDTLSDSWNQHNKDSRHMNISETIRKNGEAAYKAEIEWMEKTRKKLLDGDEVLNIKTGILLDDGMVSEQPEKASVVKKIKTGKPSSPTPPSRSYTPQG